MAKKIALVLSGCGVFDGSEIHEAVLSLLALKKKGYDVEFLAPDMDQAHVVNHLAGEESKGEKRNVRVEASRIARGAVKDIAQSRAAEYDGVFFPGGFGAAKNLSSFAFEGAKMKVNPDVEKLVRESHEAGKPLGFVCISPTIAARVLGSRGVQVTIGNNTDVAAAIESWGAKHVNKPVDQAVVDKANKVVTAPAYMYDTSITDIEKSINAAVDAFAELVG